MSTTDAAARQANISIEVCKRRHPQTHKQIHSHTPRDVHSPTVAMRRAVSRRCHGTPCHTMPSHAMPQLEHSRKFQFFSHQWLLLALCLCHIAVVCQPDKIVMLLQNYPTSDMFYLFQTIQYLFILYEDFDLTRAYF